MLELISYIENHEARNTYYNPCATTLTLILLKGRFVNLRNINSRLQVSLISLDIYYCNGALIPTASSAYSVGTILLPRMVSLYIVLKKTFLPPYSRPRGRAFAPFYSWSQVSTSTCGYPRYVLHRYQNGFFENISG